MSLVLALTIESKDDATTKNQVKKEEKKNICCCLSGVVIDLNVDNLRVQPAPRTVSAIASEQ